MTSRMTAEFSQIVASGSRPKVLITGGAGTVGQAFIRRFRHEFDIINVSRNETAIHRLKSDFPEVESLVADVQDLDKLTRLFQQVKPDIVIHAAALKHVNIAELNPSQTVEINILGSLNVAKASMRSDVKVVVGVSTDKACQPENIYGYSKKILEQIFLEHFTESTRFVCARFANVACSNGSVIPFWIESAQKGQPLKLTDSRMNRLMFTSSQAAQLIRDAIAYAVQASDSFVLCKVMKSVGMLDLANQISAEFGNGQKPEIVGLRPGEKLNETLVSNSELKAATYTDNNQYIMLHNPQFGSRPVTETLSSLTAEYMSEQEMRFLYAELQISAKQKAAKQTAAKQPSNELSKEL